MRPRVSVVVPMYNVAPYLEECLESLAQQTMADLEVVIVDDGSTDASPEIAERFAARDPRFRLVHQANAGLGAARNTGARHATGEFLAFVDSDDLVTRHAYELLLGALDHTGSDIASGSARRLTSFGTTRSFLAKACERTRLATHITRFPNLIVDRTAWNKLYRRSFWDEHGFRFPEGVYYEDIPVTLPAHYLAKSVDVIEQTVYLWRVREGDDLSITQRRTETKALRDRVAAVDFVSRFLAERKLKISKAVYDRTVLSADLRYFLEVLPYADDEYHRLFVQLTNDFIDRADPWALDQPLAIDRLKWHLVRRPAVPELLEVLRFEQEELREVPPVRVGKHWYGDYPYRTDERLRIPKRVYRLSDELAPVFRLESLRWEGEKLRIEGFAYVSMLGAPGPDTQRIDLVVRQRGWLRRRLVLPTESVHRPDVTAEAAQQFAPLDWSGFVATLDGGELKSGGRWREGTWEIGARLRSGGVARTGWRPEPAAMRPVPVAELSLEDGTQVRAGLDARGWLTVAVQRRRSVVTSCVLEDGVLQLEGEVGALGKGEPRLHVSRRIGAATLEYPLYVDRSGRPKPFLARIPVEDLIREVDVGDAAAHVEQQAEGVAWDLYLAGGSGLKRLHLDAAASEQTWTVDGREIGVRRTREGEITVTEAWFRPVVTDVEWSPRGALVVAGTFRAPADDYELALSIRSSNEVYSVPLGYDSGTGRFRAELTPAAVPSLAGTRPLHAGLWELVVGRRGAPLETAVGTVVAPGLLEELPVSTENGKRFHFGVVSDDSAALAVERDLDDDERGGFQQRRLRTSVYAAERERELRAAVVYDCFGGREYSDSPRAIHEELVARDAPLEHLWIVRDAAFEVPATAVPVRRGSREHVEALARARYVVANDHWPRWFERRPEQVCVQTWHGAPLKRLGLDLADRPQAVQAYRRVLAERPENWQYVVSPGPFATPVLEQAFPGDPELVETGLPRTDLLHRSDRDAIAADLRRRLGIEGKRVVLYAPTYRDHLDHRTGLRVTQHRALPAFSADVLRRDGYRLPPLLDLAALHSALGEEQVVLFRRHRLIVDGLPAAAEPHVLDVSGYPDATELLLAADVLVTDYSSLFFDFARTGRPIVFFTPDLEAYRDDVRGFSIDFEAVAPGPLLRTTDEVIEALRDPEAVLEAHRERYERFVAAYCPLDDGRASARLVERVFSW
ncbi:MAG: CDP-glycerol glycerophosphotransferase family protein [Gaiellaceae bacterium]